MIDFDPFDLKGNDPIEDPNKYIVAFSHQVKMNRIRRRTITEDFEIEKEYDEDIVPSENHVWVGLS